MVKGKYFNEPSKRIRVTLSEVLLKKIERFQTSRNITYRGEAIRAALNLYFDGRFEKTRWPVRTWPRCSKCSGRLEVDVIHNFSGDDELSWYCPKCEQRIPFAAVFWDGTEGRAVITI